MKTERVTRCLRILAQGSLLLGITGCLGPNPGFFVSTSAANAGIFTVVNTFLANALGIGGG